MAQPLLHGSVMRLVLALALATLASGCQLYFGGDDEPPVTCGYGGYGGAPEPDPGVPSQLLRNPQTGDCEVFGGYGGGGGWGNCFYDEDYDQCVCDDVAEPTAPPAPNWPACESSCSILDEETCLSEPGCQVAYWEEEMYDLLPPAPLFRGCYATLGGPDIYTSCFNLDAYECAQQDSCSIFYTANYDHPPPLGGGGMTPNDSYAQFTQCRPEPTNAGCAAVDCGPGYHCEDSCYPTPGGGSQCTPMCVPDQGHGCANIDCGPGYECVETCDTMEPTPIGGCFPGQCYGTCVPTTACESLTTESACNARTDCTSVYNGDDCTCYPGGFCECEILTWDHCESLGAVPMPF
ncbi:MAG: hypothetical protein ACKV2T_17105 [Kofleriaceae bacterium]